MSTTKLDITCRDAENRPGRKPADPASIALVHDYLTQIGGAEEVLRVLSRMYPAAPVLTSLALPSVAAALGLDGRVTESALGRLPGLRGRHRLATPFYPAVFAALGRTVGDARVVIADTSAWAHLIPIAPAQRLIAYCHSPARFLYGDDDYLAAANVHGGRRAALTVGTAPYRWWDRRAARRVDLFLANSRNVAARIERIYGREARVVYPPIDVSSFRPARLAQPDRAYLIVSRLVPHKRVDLAIEAVTATGDPLTVIGEGRDRGRLEAMAGQTVTFRGRQPADVVRNELQRCRALILPSAEDFGMTAVEAQAAGRPVIAYGSGGALESVIDGETGILFPEPTVDSLVGAMDRLDAMPFDPAAAIRSAERFDTGVFQAAIHRAVADVLSTGRPA